ncbi:NAD(P)-dependent oxidoreductase [Kibdelosporangium persicum]|uniref:Nucleoside-diphosphate-sugar epimerase n=1 Tax=Kibdelosporangium persicum TaxID=2698649 RepID=A0ABX2FCJ1_9PSEU|nr:NAD(P)-dependent oxidoreductase [Kibdelosporangium persicum]NRN69083.1 Nucleoside-diphosphate-sugar epimerase [Kibdelosporangium persicum]
MKRVLLFGGTGFLGSKVVTALDGRATVIQAGRRSALRHDLVNDDVTKLMTLLREVKPDVVVNCTGLLSGSAADLVSANVLTTAYLLDAIGSATAGTRLVVMGSAGEYGVVPVGKPVTEDSPTAPVAAYGVTKLASTMMVASSPVDAVSLRVFNPIGPGVGADTVLGRAAASIRTALHHGETKILLGPLDSYRDFVDVRDVASAIATVALADAVPHRVLNVGSGHPVLIRDAVKLLAEVAGFTGEISEADPPVSRSGAVTWIAADTTRLTALGWRPQHDLATAIRTLW